MKLHFTRNPQKSGGHLRANRTPVMGYQFMKKHTDEYSIRDLAAVFGVSPSAYYPWAKQGVSERRSTEDAELFDFIREIGEQHHGR
ncbi:MAG: hypothetical protein LBU25_07175 [Treponema sp.]|nr:hypothetical protein [Treponema sp.]